MGIRVGTARECALVGARGRDCLYARGRARCAALPVLVAADVRVPDPDISAPGVAARRPERLSGTRALKSGVAGRRAACCWVAAPLRGRSGHPCCGEGRRAGSLQFGEGCGLDPSCSGDVPGPTGPRPEEKPTCFAVWLAAPLLCEVGEIAGSLRMRCPEAHVQGGYLRGCYPDSETELCLSVRAANPFDFLTLF